MKKILISLTLVLLTAPAFGSVPTEIQGDLFPWPWGTECPFPWKDISGSYMLESSGNSGYSRHILVFEASGNSRNNLKFLNIAQYDHKGFLYAEGRGYSQQDQRVVKGVMSPVGDDKDYVMMLRSYVKDENKSCRGSNLVTAVTFCPLRGKKCLEDSNYVLLKIKN